MIKHDLLLCDSLTHILQTDGFTQSMASITLTPCLSPNKELISLSIRAAEQALDIQHDLLTYCIYYIFYACHS